jgi:hypothetical protein
MYVNEENIYHLCPSIMNKILFFPIHNNVRKLLYDRTQHVRIIRMKQLGPKKHKVVEWALFGHERKS